MERGHTAPSFTWDRADSFGLNTNLGNEGVAFWFRGFNNYVHDNVAADAGSYGYTYYARFIGSGGTVYIPTAAGSDDRTPVNMNETPLLQFDNNEAYGATPSGMTIWWLGVGENGTSTTIDESKITGLKVWNVHEQAYFGYETSHLTIDGAVFRDHLPAQSGHGFDFNDYTTRNLLVIHADVEGMRVGFIPSTDSGSGTQTVQDSYFDNYVNIVVNPMWTSGYTSDYIRPRTTIIRNVRFAHPNMGEPPDGKNIVMDGQAVESVSNLVQSDKVFVYDYNGVPDDNFRLYYNEQAANYVLPQTTFNEDGTAILRACPLDGLTNAESWAIYGVAFAGAIVPDDATPRNGIWGLVEPF